MEVVKNSEDMKARTTELNTRDGSLQGRVSAAADAPGCASAWVHLRGDRCLGKGQMLEKSWCPWARAAPGAEPRSGVLGASLISCSCGFGARV